MLSERGRGFALGLSSSALFGLIPLFTLPLMQGGMMPESALFYRFLLAMLMTGGILVARRERVLATGPELWRLAVTSLFYSLAALFLFQSYQYLPSGVASTIQFSYPILVMLLMITFFGEKLSILTIAACGLALLGVALLSGVFEVTGLLSAPGIALSLGSALTCALYVVSLCRVRLAGGLVVLFYLFLFGALYALGYALATDTFCWLDSWRELALASLLAFLTAVLANLTLVWAVARIGSTLSAVLGAMEPLTTVLIGVLVFHEPFTLILLAGVTLIVGAVVLIMAAPLLAARRHRV